MSVERFHWFRPGREEPASSRTWKRAYHKQEMNAADPEGGCTFDVNELLLSGHPLHQSISVYPNKVSFILLQATSA
jgi:hypothetical protein